MTEKTQKAVKRGQRDAYDDFLDGIVTPSGKKTASSGRTKKTGASDGKKASEGSKRTGNSSKKSGSGAKKSSSAGKTAAGKKASPDKKDLSAAKKASGASGTKKKTSGTKGASAGKKTASRKEYAVEAGIVSLGAHGANAKTARHGASAGKHAPKAQAAGKHSAVMVVDNPVARGDEWTRPRSGASDRTGKSASRKKGSAAVRSDRRSAKYREDERSARSRAKHSSGKRAKSGKGKKHSSRKRARMTGWDVFLSLGIVCMLGFMLWQGTQYSDFLMKKQAVDRQTYYPGTTIEGVDVSDMTYDEAMQYWQTEVEPWYADRTVIFDNGESVTASQLGYSSDYATVLANAWSAGRSGSLEERYRAVASRKETPVAYSVTRTPYTEDMVDRFTAYAADKVDLPATEAKIESFDMKKFKFVLSDPQPGKKLDKNVFKADVMKALDAGGGSVTMVVDDVAPTTDKKEVAGRYGMITSAITNASSSSKNRLTNIKRSLELIHGTCLKPGETFSFNDVVGERTKARGFKEATAYSSGEVTEQVGGGICQVSTTLFNAAVKADLEIVERHNHSLTVGYVDLGKDAAVNWGSQDLRFKNNTEDDIYICCYLTDDKRVRFGIFGKLLPDGETITVEGVTTEEIEYETEYQASGLLVPGEEVVLQKGKNGYKAEAYKLRWNAKGKLISRELLCKSKYKTVTEIIQYCP